MMECKRALVLAEGDMKQAAELLRMSRSGMHPEVSRGMTHSQLMILLAYIDLKIQTRHRLGVDSQANNVVRHKLEFRAEELRKQLIETTRS